MEGFRGPAERWLLARVDRSAVEVARALIRTIAEQLAMATSDGVTIRRLVDGMLVPVAAYHADRERGAALAGVMKQTTDPHDGLWKAVIEARRSVRWHVPAGARPDEANATQAQFLARYPVRAILGAPLMHDDEVIGGVALIRFGSDLPYTDADEALLGGCARRIAAAVCFQAEIESLAAPAS